MDPLARHFTNYVHPRVTRQGWDYTTAITGDEGSSKSTLAAWLLKITEPQAQLHTRVGLTPLSYLRLFQTLPHGAHRIGDEWIKAANKMRHSTKTNIETEEAFMTLRGLVGGYHTVIMPRLTDFGRYWREHRIKLWLLVTDRGHARVHLPRRDPYGKNDTYWEYQFDYEYPDYSKHHPAEWSLYQSLKDKFMSLQLERAINLLNGDTNNNGAGAHSDNTPEQTDAQIARTIANDPDYWTKQGWADKGHITTNYPRLSRKSIDNIARTARSIRTRAQPSSSGVWRSD